jgi:hypothetical protein
MNNFKLVKDIKLGDNFDFMQREKSMKISSIHY